MFIKDQIVAFSARVVDAHDRGGIILTVDDPENARDGVDNFFSVSARALEIGIDRAAGPAVKVVNEPGPTWTGDQNAPEPVKSATKRRGKKTTPVEAP